MNWLPRIGRRRRLAPHHAAALGACEREPAPDLAAGAGDLRLVVVDVETTGLRPYHDRLLAIGAVAVSSGLIQLNDTFETTLRQVAPSAVENILVHGINGAAQMSGVEAPDALIGFLQFTRNSPLIAFHADFDRVFLSRALDEALGAKATNPWLDLADLAPAFFPEHAEKAQTLDDWTAIFEIENPARHAALADAVATAQLLQVVLSRAAERQVSSVSELAARAQEHRWLMQSLKAF